jgi:hypothetical protein
VVHLHSGPQVHVWTASPPGLAAGQAPDLSVVNRPIRRVGLSPTYLVSFTGCFGAIISGGRPGRGGGMKQGSCRPESVGVSEGYEIM